MIAFFWDDLMPWKSRILLKGQKEMHLNQLWLAVTELISIGMWIMEYQIADAQLIVILGHCLDEDDSKFL